MSTLVEMIEALQSECLKDPDEFVPGTDVAFLEDVAKRLTPILAASRAQEQELADLHVASDMVAMELAAKQEELAAMKEQPSTDLREIAEMAIEAGENHGKKYPNLRAKAWVTADSIVREFREKQQKSKGGDAQ